MRYVYKCLLSGACFLASTFIICAQKSIEDNPNVRESLDNMFADLDKNRVPTGLLLDYAVNLVDLFEYDGDITEDNYVTLPIFDDILRTIRSSAVLTEPFGEVMPFLEEFSNPIFSEEVNIGIALFDVSYIAADALSDHKLNYNSTTKKVSDRYLNGVWQNPYEQVTVLAFSPNTNMSIYRNITYNFSSLFFLSNVVIDELFFDAGDGLGYREVQLNSTINVLYNSCGDKELKLKIFMSDGVTLESHSIICVSEVDATGPMATKQPSDSSVLSYSSAGRTVEATVTYYSHYSDGMIRKPFIYVEGFDPVELMELMGDEADRSGFTNHVSGYDNFDLSNEYDFIYVDWHNSIIDMRVNAELLIKIIDEVNERKGYSGSTERNVVFGHSMGGLIARYALVMMEKRGQMHQVGAYVSHDAPHLGANVPLGVLYFIPQVLSMLRGNNVIHDLLDYVERGLLSEAESKLYEVLHSDAVRQMLVNYVTTDGRLSNVVHEMWLEEIDRLGFPQGDDGQEIENLCIVNGALCDFSQYFVDNSYLLSVEGFFHTKYLTDVITAFLYFLHLPYRLTGNLDLGRYGGILLAPGSLDFNLSATVKPLTSANSGKKISELRLDFTKRFLWCIPIEYNLFSSVKYAPSSGLFYDEFPGSYYDIPNFVPSFQGQNGWGNYDILLSFAEKIMFIPVASALCVKSLIPLKASDYMRNYYINPPIPEEETPFDSYYLRDTASSHVNLDVDIFSWLNTQINMSIEGPKVVHSDTTYTISGYSGNVQWSTSDSSIATIDNEGNLTIVGNGFVNVIAESHVGGQLYRESRAIMVNFPDLVIIKSFVVGAGYKFVANALNASEQSRLNDMIGLYDLEYEWTRIDGYGDRETVRTSNNVYEFLPYTDSATSISVRIVDANDNKGPLYTITYSQQCPFFVNFKYISIGRNGRVRFVSYDDMTLPYPYMDFGVQYLSNSYDPSDNVNNVPYKYLKGSSCFLRYLSGDNVEYFQGTSGGVYIWLFDLFDSRWFLDKLNAEIDKSTNGVAQAGDIVDMELVICNTLYEPLQRIPFALIHED